MIWKSLTISVAVTASIFAFEIWIGASPEAAYCMGMVTANLVSQIGRHYATLVAMGESQ